MYEKTLIDIIYCYGFSTCKSDSKIILYKLTV